MFKRGIDPFPSSKEILNRNNGNVWIMVDQDGKFHIHDTKTNLPTEATVDPYRSQPKFQMAQVRNEPYVLLDQVKPWQMAVTKPMASIRSFALHASESEWNKFWEACLEVKKEYEEQNGTTLYMYTDHKPSLAQFHVNFSINMPKVPATIPKKKKVQDMSHLDLKVGQSQWVMLMKERMNDPKYKDDPEVQAFAQKYFQIGKIPSAPKQAPKEWQVAQGGCAKPGDEVYMIVINTSDIYGKVKKDFARLLVMIKGGIYDLVHTTWKKDTTPERSMEEYLRRIAYDTPMLALTSFSDVTDTVDFTNQESCVRVLINYTGKKWDTSRSSEKVDMVSLEDFWKLRPTSSVLKAVQVHMKGVMDRYFERLN